MMKLKSHRILSVLLVITMLCCGTSINAAATEPDVLEKEGIVEEVPELELPEKEGIVEEVPEEERTEEEEVSKEEKIEDEEFEEEQTSFIIPNIFMCYIVNFNTNSSERVIGLPYIYSQLVFPGQKINRPAEPAIGDYVSPILNERYVFEGWYKDSNFTELWDFDRDVVTDDMTLYAKFIKKCKIHFYTCGGGNIADSIVLKGEKISVPKEPQMDGCVFRGWYKDWDYTEKWDFEKDVVTKDMDLYAAFEVIGPRYILRTAKETLKGLRKRF